MTATVSKSRTHTDKQLAVTNVCVILAFFHSCDDGSKVIVQQNHIRGLLTDIGPSYAHRHSYRQHVLILQTQMAK